MVCKPKDCGGLEILNLTKFASTLRIRWLWHDRNDEAKPWKESLGNPCTPQNVELCAAATLVNIGNRRKALFWEASSINGRRPKDIAPLIFEISKRKKKLLS
jgi:hypothetical protein